MIVVPLLAAWLGAAAPATDPPLSHHEVRRLALVFGSNVGGVGREDLRYAGDDARAFSRVLEQLGGVASADRTLLLEPRRAEVDAAFEQLRAQAKEAVDAGRRVELIVYYSGHSDEQGLMLGHDRMSYGELRRRLEQVPAQVRVAILDSCASGEFTRQKGGTRVAPFLLDASTQLVGHAFLSSSSADEAAQESDRIGGSFFTHYLVSGLRGAADFSGDRRVTLNEAYQFAFNETLRRTEATRSGPQHPAYEIQLTGTGELVMTDLRTTRSGLELPRALHGRVFVRDAGGRLVAELEKHPGHRVELGLEAGDYRVTLEREGKAWQVALTVPEGGVASLSEPELVAVAREQTRARGGEAAPLVPVNVAFAPWMGVNDAFGKLPTNYFSLNLLGTSGGSLHGLGIGVGELRRGDLRGLSFQGLGSWVGGDMLGGQVAGAANVASANARGWQAAGATNIVRGTLHGGQVAGALNVTAGELRGAQLAGAANFAGGPAFGLQVAGGLNYAPSLRGAQIGVVNVGGSVKGLQLGVVNIAEEVDGVQLGVVNLARRMRGVPFGVVSLIGDGQLHAEVWGSDTHPVSVGVRFGSRTFYTFLSEATQDLRLSGPYRGYTAMGFGVRFPLGPVDLDVDLMGGTVHQNFRSDDLQLLNKLRVSVDRRLARRLHVFGGLALNNWISRSEEVPAFVRLPSREVGSERTQVRFWPGAFAGLRL